VAKVARLDLGTVLLATAPGSPGETTAVAAEAGFRAELVAALQLGRVLAALLVAALLTRLA